MNNYKNILVVRTDKIGDVVLTLPFAGLLKKIFPGCKVTFLVQEYTKPLVEACGNIDKVISLKKVANKSLLRENVTRLKEENFDLCFTVSPKFKLALILKLAGIGTRVGTGYRWYSFLFNKKIFEHRKTAERHELEYNLNLLKPLGINFGEFFKSVDFSIQLTDKNKAKTAEIFKSLDINQSKKSIIIHPGSGGSAVDWPQSHFLELTKKMAQELDVNILITGSESEKELCNKLVVSNNVYNLAGLFDLGEFLSLINRAEILVANSTGPIHLAAALDKFVIGFYPKIKVCSKERWGPYTKNKFIFEPEICNGECTRETCSDLDCMKSIKPDKVFEKVDLILKGEI